MPGFLAKYNDNGDAPKTRKNKNKKYVGNLDDLGSETFAQARNLSTFWPSFSENKPEECSGVIIKKKPKQEDPTSNRQKIWFFKNTASIPRFSFRLTKIKMQETFELEAAVSEIWRFLLGERSPKNRCIIDNDNTVIGLMSKGIDGFKTALEIYRDDPNFFNLDNLVQFDIASILAAAYFLEDIDLNIENWGFSDDLNTFVKIDHGWSLSSLVAKEYKAELSPPDKKKHIVMLKRPILESDILNLPLIDVRHWHNWFEPVPDLLIRKIPRRKGFMSTKSEKVIFKSLAEDETFKNQKYKMLLKILVMPMTLVAASAKNHIDSWNSTSMFVNYFTNRLGELRTTVIAMSEFQDYVETNPELLKTFKAEAREFMAHNRRFQDLKLDTLVETHYTELLSSMRDNRPKP